MQIQERLTRTVLRLLIAVSAVMLVFTTYESFQLIGHPFAGFRCETTLTVSANGDPNWNGFKAHLQQFDRILRVDGHPMRHADDLTAYVRSKPVGTVLTYDVMRDKKPLSLKVPTQSFTLAAWMSFLPLLLTGLLHLLVGSTAYAVKPKNVTSRVHLLMNLATCLFCTSGTDYDSGHLLGRLYIASLSLMASTYIHLGLVFPNPPHWLNRRRWVHALPYLPTLLLLPFWEAIFQPAGYLASGAERFELHMSLQDLSFLWVMIGMLGLVVSIVVRLTRTKIPLVRQQAKVALLGAIFGYLPGVLLWILPTVANLQNFDSSGFLANLAFICPVLFPLSVAYAIIRHKMFDIDLVIKRTAVYATVIVALTGVYLLTIGLVRVVIDRLFGASGSDVGNVLATALVAVAFVPVRNRVQALIDRLFYRNRYDFRTVLSEYSKFTKENPELASVVDKYVDLLNATVHPRHMAIMVRDPKTRNLHVYKQSGLSILPADFAIKADTPEIAELFSARRTGMRPSKATTRQLSHMDALGIALCVPLEIKGEILGMVNVGAKLSELDYTAEDQSLLINMGQQLASVIRIHEMTKAEVKRARLDAEIETARHIQASLLPTAAPAPEGLEVMASSVSAYEFGGDYFDLVTLHDGQLRIAVGDVAGKGVQAAMVMAMAKSCFFNQVRTNPDLPTVMSAINSMIIETIEDKTHRKTSLIYAVIDPKQQTLRYSCAGHQAPHYFNAEKGTVEELAIPGSFPFGVSKLGKYQEVEVPLHSGDVLVFYTDGVTEAANRDGEMFYRIEDGPDGTERVYDRLAEVMAIHHSESAHEIHQRILHEVTAWMDGGPQADDITLVVVKVG